MNPRTICDNVWAVGTIDWDRRLFDELIPLPEGTSYNAYLIKTAEKTVLIDTVDPPVQEQLLHNLQQLEVDRLDYLASNHAEQDHSGAIPAVLETYPEARVVTNPKCRDMLIDHLHVPGDRFEVKENGESLDIGGRTLQFFTAPFVHWPETQFTWLAEEKILFTGDFLGSHLATSALFVENEAEVYVGAKRYYAEIMMPFRKMFGKYLDLIDELGPEMIASTHGPIYPRPAFILDAYREWISEDVKNEAVIAYLSMHDSTAEMIHHLINALIDHDIRVKVHNLTDVDLGELAIDLVDAATLVLASPTVLVGPHPSAAYAALVANALKPKARFGAIVGSFGWGGKMVEQLQALTSNLKLEWFDPVMVKGKPRPDDFATLEALAEAIAGRHREAGIS